ncbi:surfeit locus protein 6 homolog [Halyomorpha halys]|uniref:surfeit locus protein 6 homolog n=1 Tax=Halyomorpha halys TaxID=286706 RepID=UPI0006D4F2AC|nr:surfeit locus protein 6 homolog [Halyomorpha halys]
MADTFKQCLLSSSFKLLEIKEKKILLNITNADLLCGYVNKFLPHKFTTNHGKNNQNEEDSENDELELPEKPSLLENAVAKTSRAKTIEELHKRIETLRGKRASYKERLLKKGLKNRLKKKQKLEERKNLKKNNIKLEKLESENVIFEPNNDTKDALIKDEPEETDIKFNKFLISESDSTPKQRLDPKSLLAKLEKKKLKLKKLESKGKQEKLTEIKSKEAWDSAIQKAEGVKVKDDIELLKKSVSKIKNRKNKSKRKWEEREKQVESKKEKVQKKRQENIVKKRKERSKKRTKMLVKKGRILPK